VNAQVRGKRGWALAVLIVPSATLVVFLILVGLSARSLSNRILDTGSIELFDVSLTQATNQWFLDAKADIDLPSTNRAGLDSGVPLNFIASVRLFQPRRLWFDKTVATFERRYSLTYYELTRHYRVESKDTGASYNYRSLLSALEGLGKFNRVALSAGMDLHAQINHAAPLLAALEVWLDTRALPLPLQPLITSSWRLSSEEYVWPVN
jgi:hypothetical protein